MLDVIIRGGEVVDGSGAPRRRADVAIEGDRIVEIGRVDATAGTEIDATNRIVCPGFIDVHTHLDAQVFWDTTLSPSPLHGVTSVIGGNCGFTIAPLSDDPADGDYLMRMLSRVEGMPLESLQAGVPWNWTTTGEYLDSFDDLAVNAGFKVGHSALRRVVMGDDAVRREATPDEVTAMQALLRAGLEAGAIGFSSSWARTHNDPMGNMVPSRYASRDELIELARVCCEFEGTALEFIPCIGAFDDWAAELMADMSVAAQSPLNWNVLNVAAKLRDEAGEKLAASDVAAAKGGRVVALTVPMDLDLRLSFAGGFILDALPDWEQVMLLPKAEKMAVLADPEQRRRLDDLAQQEGPLRPVAHWAKKVIFDVVSPDNAQYRGRTVGEIAEEEGKTPFDALVDIALTDELATSFGNPVRDVPRADWETRLEVWRDHRAVIGASDAGAHLDVFLTANYATTMLQHAVRDHSLLPIEEAIHLLTDVPAQLYGLRDRGRIEPGLLADLVVLDETTVGSGETRTRVDLPADAPRLYADAVGIDHVLCNGVPIVRNGRFTDARPGTRLRSGRDTRSPAMT